MLGHLDGIDMGAVDVGERTEQRGLAAGSGAHVQPPSAVLPDDGRHRDRACDKLAALVLHTRETLTDGVEFAGIAAGQVHTVGRVVTDLSATGQGELLGGDETGPGHEVHRRALVVGGQCGLQQAGRTSQCREEDLGDPARMRVPERQMPDDVVGDRRCELIHPDVLVALGYLAQHRIHETGRPHAVLCADEIDRGGHRRMRSDACAQQLIGAQAQHVEELTVDLGDRATRGRRDDRVDNVLRACGPVGQLGGQRGITAGDVALAQHLRQNEVGVGVSFPDRT